MSAIDKLYPGIDRITKNLKPCPFCSSNFIEILSMDYGNHLTGPVLGWKVRCVECDASVFEISDYFTGVSLKWNKRNGKMDMDLLYKIDTWKLK